MSSILGLFTRKSFYPIDQLYPNAELGVDFNFYETNLNRGHIHSLFSQISYNEYNKLFKLYSETTNIENQYFYSYSNNRIGILSLEDKTQPNKIVIDKWEFVQPSHIYSFRKHQTCYAIDEFDARRYVQTDNLKHISVRLVAHGNWFSFDCKRLVFLGCRILPPLTRRRSCSDIEYIAFDKREDLNLPNLSVEPATFPGVHNLVKRRVDYFIMFRNISSFDRIYNELQITNLYKSQKLLHLIGSDDLSIIF